MYLLQRLTEARTLLGCSVAELSSTYRSSQIARSAIIGVFLVNILFVVMHIMVKISGKLGIYHNTSFFLNVDWSYPEIFGYFLSVSCAVFLFLSFLISKQYIYLSLSIVFIFIALDDSMLIHEEIGSLIASECALPTLRGLRPQDLGELIVWGFMAGILLPITLLGFWSSSRESIGFGAVIASALTLLVFFAVGIDMLNVVVDTGSGYIESVRKIIEDGGEMLALGLTFALSLLLLLNISAKRTAKSSPSEQVRESRRGFRAAKSDGEPTDHL